MDVRLITSSTSAAASTRERASRSTVGWTAMARRGRQVVIGPPLQFLLVRPRIHTIDEVWPFHDEERGTHPASRARATACSCEFTPSLRSRLRLWDRTVVTATNDSSAT